VHRLDVRRHPDHLLGKKNAEQLLKEFQETFQMHHRIFNGDDQLEKVSKQEFVDYYAHVSATYEMDHQFTNMIQNVWNLDYKSYGGPVPFAGAKDKVLNVDHKQGYVQNNHRNVFGGQAVPFGVD